MPEPTSVISCVTDLIGHVRALHEETGRRWLFRGHSNAEWPLTPSVYRAYVGDEERYLTQEFRARAGGRHAHRPRYGDYADWLALMQHYGLPTRLLDWSHSPLIAAFFATDPTMPHADRGRSPVVSAAAIWALCPTRLNKAQGLKSYIYPLNSGDLEPLVAEAFYQSRKPLRQRRPAVAAAMAVETDIRMQVQRGAFTIHGSGDSLNVLPGNRTWLRKFVVPADAVSTFGAEVNLLGLGLADVFPDLNSLARDLASRIGASRRATAATRGTLTR